MLIDSRSSLFVSLQEVCFQQRQPISERYQHYDSIDRGIMEEPQFSGSGRFVGGYFYYFEFIPRFSTAQAMPKAVNSHMQGRRETERKGRNTACFRNSTWNFPKYPPVALSHHWLEFPLVEITYRPKIGAGMKAAQVSKQASSSAETAIALITFPLAAKLA